MKLFVLFVAFVFIGLSAGNTFADEAQFVIVNINAPGVGFNDPTPGSLSAGIREPRSASNA